MANRIKIDGSVAYVTLTRGRRAVIDTSDVPRVVSHHWSAGKYVFTFVELPNGRPTTLYMHRLITGAPKGKDVDHINHDTLDNRRENLRVGSHKDNMQNGRFALATHCPKGHPYDEANTYWMKLKHGRQCRECARLFTQAALERETPKQKAKREARKKTYYENNIEARRAKMREYAAAHKEEAKARMARWLAKRKTSS